jgi:hypothetical protein
MTVVSTRRTRGVSRLDARTMASTAHNHPADAAGFEPASPLALQAVSLLLCAHRLASLTHARRRSAIACDSTNTGDIASNSNPGARARTTHAPSLRVRTENTNSSTAAAARGLSILIATTSRAYGPGPSDRTCPPLGPEHLDRARALVVSRARHATRSRARIDTRACPRASLLVGPARSTRR